MQLNGFDGDSQQSIQSNTDGQFRDTTVKMGKKTETLTITITGSTYIDLQLVLDYSGAFYPADLVLTAVQKNKPVSSDLSE